MLLHEGSVSFDFNGGGLRGNLRAGQAFELLLHYYLHQFVLESLRNEGFLCCSL